MVLYLFPFIRHAWSRKISKTESDTQIYCTPKEDTNAPDLYIPFMAFITYVLLFGFILTDSEIGFQPALLEKIAFFALLIFGLEVLVVKTLFYLFLPKDNVPFLDMLSFCGYKFVTLDLLIVLRCMSYFLFSVAYIVSFIQMGVFMIKTLRLAVPQSFETEHRTIRNYILGLIALFQGVFIFFLL